MLQTEKKRAVVPRAVGPRSRRDRAKRFLGTRRGQTVAAALVYLAFAVAHTWPFVIHPGDTILGIAGADLTANITKFRELAQDLQPPFLPGDVPDLNAPMGLNTEWTVDLASFSSSTGLWTLSVMFGGIAANGIWVLTSLTLSALSMFLLARWLTGHAGGSFLAGLAFGFWPLSFSSASVPFGQEWVLVLLVWRMLVLLERPTTRNALFAGLAGVLTISWTPYWLLIGGVLYATLAVTSLAVAATRGRGLAQLRTQVIAGALPLAFLAFLLAVASGTDFTGVPERTTAENIALSARPLMYVLPDPGNPFLGDASGDILQKRYATTAPTEGRTVFLNPLYLGISTMLLGLIGLLWTAHHFVRHRWTALGERISSGAIAAAAAGLTALAFSFPPEVTIRGVVINFPMHYVNQLTTTFRATARFGVVVMLALCIFAAIGARELLRRPRAATAAPLFAILAVVIAADLYVERDPRATRVTFPSIYTTLRDEPEGIVAEYPIGLAVTQRDNYAIWHQDAHGYPLFNGYRQDTESESMKIDLDDLENRRTIPALANLGVRYIVIQRLITPPPNLPKPGSHVRGLELLDQDEFGALYRVRAKPARAIALLKRGFDYVEANRAGGLWRWVIHQNAQIEVRGSCDPCDAILAFRAGPGYNVPRGLTVRDSRGRVLARRRIEQTKTPVHVPLRFSRRTTVTIRTDPPPKPAYELGPLPDARPLGVRLWRPLTVEPATAREGIDSR
jgi:hypothetical protein